MSQNVIVRRIRPYLFTSYHRCQSLSTAYRQFSATTASKLSQHDAVAQQEERQVTNDYERRVSHLESVSPPSQWYPRLHRSRDTITPIEQFRHDCQHLKGDETDSKNTVTIVGRIRSIRTAGSKLIFVDVEQDTSSVQAIVNYGKLQESATAFLASEAFEQFRTIARKGDHFSFHGHPHRTYRGQLSVLCNAIPTLLAPSLHQIPDSLDPETRARKRHVDMLVNPSAAQVLKIRHVVEKSLTSFLDAEGFTSVHTPILTSGAGGAIARPFETEATEFAGEALTLRIAPELWLKRLIVGGMEKVYEVGPAFRNEGVDATHNPEFYTCEFYEAYATLEDLMAKTEKMLLKLSDDVAASKSTGSDIHASFPPPEIAPPFKRIAFLPALEAALGQPLPSLTTPSAADSIKTLFRTNNLPIPTNPTLPRLLDALATHYLEPLSHSAPTFITHHPAILSPLAKHFPCPLTHQPVAARAELFVRGWEVANMYEEENSPFEQRRKFLQQARQKDVDGEAMEVDEGFLEALEWGLPPTGGWGCGVERLVMLFAGRERIGEVLAFGGLRNVVGVGRGRQSRV